jgi:hypothetical protein
VCPKQFLRLWYVWRKPSTHLAVAPKGQNEIPHDPHQLGVLWSVSKMIFEPVVSSMQTVHLSYISISTISKQTESSFHMSLVT